MPLYLQSVHAHGRFHELAGDLFERGVVDEALVAERLARTGEELCRCLDAWVALAEASV